MRDFETRTLNQMHVTGRDIACVFVDVIPAAMAIVLTEKLLELLHNLNLDEDVFASKMMLLGALAALGEQTHDAADADSCRGALRSSE